jgi:voltage-gated potassium channel
VEVIADLIRSLRSQVGDPEFRALLFLTIGVLLVGAVFYSIVEGWNFLDSLYFCVVTLATVGYGDFAPVTPLGRAFTIVYILSGIGIIVVFVSRLASGMVEARMDPGVHRRGPLRRGLRKAEQAIEQPVETEVEQ